MWFILHILSLSMSTISLKVLKNTYFGLRHGQSYSNVEGIISSDLFKGTTSHGLTDLGREQAESSGHELYQIFKEKSPTSLNNIHFYSSLFLRAKQTTDVVINSLMTSYNNDLTKPSSYTLSRPTYKIRLSLRERYFGALDQRPLPLYNDVWPLDWENADNKNEGIESVNEVANRIDSFIQ